ncbi:MAG: FtsX-like permease family protein [Rhodospirillales bacterium]|nr:FtsX-like permease family protein [Rhodospirillales bacterium]
MFARRSDLPLDRDSLSRFLPWLIAFMVFLAVLAMAGMLMLNSTAARWDQGIRGTLTIQVIPADDPKEDGERLDKVLSVLAKTAEIERYETLSDGRLLQLLEPWLGSAAGSRDLPLPKLVDVELKPDVELNVEALSKQLQRQVPGTTVDDHRVWLNRLVRLIQTVEGVATLVLVFICFATVGTVVFTTRTGLAIHRDAIEVLHLIGAQDSYVARQFASRALMLGLQGGIFGLLLGVPTLWGIVHLARQMDSSLLPDVTIGLSHWAALVGLPVAIALIAMLTARLTVMKTLSRML